jgi:hypothetical protein
MFQLREGASIGSPLEREFPSRGTRFSKVLKRRV